MFSFFFFVQCVLVHQCDTKRHARPCIFHIAPLPGLDSKSIVKNNFVLIVTHNEIKLLRRNKLQHDTVCKQPSAVKAAMRQRAPEDTQTVFALTVYMKSQNCKKKKHENKLRQPQAKSRIQKHENNSSLLYFHKVKGLSCDGHVFFKMTLLYF